ncbi:hypothetical protein [Campylobacter sp. US33a]|uniref:DUF7222 domain-containing protein n=1 Tax=Campylobacter sp. US33a TaxID=2498120 RepID=UPI00106836AD|nr:hypothetical protein [Campylobacter sp. US33a]TEY00689.1 hypothetical protein ELQ16_08610 [Campylobacter sp. US33a]
MAYLYEIDFDEFFEKNEVDLDSFIQACENNFPLFREVANQAGFDLEDKDDVAGFMRYLQDIYKSPNGMSAGFGGFVYYTETNNFFEDNAEKIVDYLKDFSYGLGEDLDTFVSKFKNGGDYIEDALLNDGTHLKNDLVWVYIENSTYNLMDSVSIDDFEYKSILELVEEKKDELKEKIENGENEEVLAWINGDEHKYFTSEDFEELFENAQECNNEEIAEELRSSGLISSDHFNEIINQKIKMKTLEENIHSMTGKEWKEFLEIRDAIKLIDRNGCNDNSMLLANCIDKNTREFRSEIKVDFEYYNATLFLTFRELFYKDNENDEIKEEILKELEIEKDYEIDSKKLDDYFAYEAFKEIKSFKEAINIKDYTMIKEEKINRHRRNM